MCQFTIHKGLKMSGELSGDRLSKSAAPLVFGELISSHKSLLSCAARISQPNILVLHL